MALVIRGEMSLDFRINRCMGYPIASPGKAIFRRKDTHLLEITISIGPIIMHPGVLPVPTHYVIILENVRS